MKTRVLALTILLMLAGQSFSQNYVTSFAWNIAFPTVNLQDYIGKVSFRGVGIGFQRFMSRHTALGFSFNWNAFDEKKVDLIPLEVGTVSGTQLRFVNSFPTMLTGRYYTDSGNRTKVYLGGQAGLALIIQRINIGVVSLQSSNWHLALAPEIGAEAPLGRTSLDFGVRYTYAFDSGTSLGGRDDNSYSYFVLHLGLAFSH